MANLFLLDIKVVYLDKNDAPYFMNQLLARNQCPEMPFIA